MSTINETKTSPFKAMTAGMKFIAALIVAFTLAISALLVGAASATDDAYAAIYTMDESEQAVAPDAAAGEVIADDENPMSSGLDSAMIDSSVGVPLYAIAAVGIVVVAAFFAVSTRKVNSSISKMNNSIR